MSEQPVPHRVRVLARRSVVFLHRGDGLNTTDADHQPRNRIAERLTLLAIEEDERALRGHAIEHMVDDRRLSGAAEHPGARERRPLVGGQGLW